MSTVTWENDTPVVTYLVAAALANAGLLSAWLVGLAPYMVVFACQATLAGGVWAVHSIRRDRSIAILASMSMLVLGPFGAIGSIYLVRGARGSRMVVPELEDCYLQLQFPASADPVSDVFGRMTEGRAIPSQLSGTIGFSSVLAKAELSEAMLAGPTQKYQPDYLPVLKSVREETPVGVSAVTGRSKHRQTCRKHCQDIAPPISKEHSPTDLVARARSLAEAARSGVLRDDEARAARESALALLLTIRPTVTLLDDAEALLCAMLLESSRHEEIETRLGARNANLPLALRQILLRSRMRSQRHGEFSQVAMQEPRKVMEFPVQRSGTLPRSLLANPAQGN